MSTYQQLARQQALRYLRHRAELLAPVAVAVARRLPLAPPVDHTALRNTRRRLKTAERFNENRQAATLAWWGPLRRTT